MMRYLLIFALILAAAAARADLVHTNYTGGQVTGQYQTAQYDTNNNQLDAHDGGIIQVGGTYYKYGTSYSCGFVWKTVSTFCGLQVYSSPDLGGTYNNDWVPLGFPVDFTTAYWQNRCAGTAAGGGCGSSKMLYNAANNNYVWWINQFGSSTTMTTDGMIVLKCTTPAGPCSAPTEPSGLVHPRSGDFGLASDGSGNGYIAYAAFGNGQHIMVEALTADFADSAGGTSVDASGAVDEGASIFITGTATFVTFGGSCGFCSSGAFLAYASAATPLGTYSAQTTLNGGSTCQSQPRSVNTIVAGGHTTYLAVQDQWTNTNSNGNANEYYQPLTVGSSTISTFTCASTVTIPGITPTSPPAFSADQTSLPGYFTAATNSPISAVGGTQWRMQTFVPTKAKLDHIFMEIGQACNSGSGSCGALSGNVTIALTTLDGSNNPVSTLASVSLTPSQLTWGGQWLNIPLTYSSLTPGTHYGLVISHPAASTNVVAPHLYTFSSSSPYAAGVERISGNSGATWTTDTGWALMFATVPPASGGKHVRIP